ncbi:non-hydrolyzing UDP-N-acetylglucosamine 2-epimerase [Parapedobacter sp. 10938]|uniref:non-hydrolyzing UDP-N-acetylglucosamine 2-epimerase n=1 Tax=Parapedobacter flavus TaxID=3110225 RepID=UPI002DB5CE74|nr:UDP-N-acetylglucosamine 2-epimerase (non-hydrolyzing) [Parapedobacter sp. 10938]MEC3879542.1 UDP-N-acetylglucosamine 2-epimerase (non-hydrolyzing) [Parapedobacter sp. 10938]
MKRILLVFGTRPEAIKMAPVIMALSKYQTAIEVGVCVTAQHREMLDQVLGFFDVKPQFDLNLMQQNQSLFGLTADIIKRMESVLHEFRPDMVLVHGDTSTSMAASLASHYAKIPVGHVEAGLRTYQRYAPFPEEMNRQLTGKLATYHFAPTEGAKANLLSEGIPSTSIFVTGNTVVDALYWSSKALEHYEDDEIAALKALVNRNKKCVLVTAHRRENQETGLYNICDALVRLAAHPDTEIVFPVHRNPVVRKIVYERLAHIDNIKLIDPLGYPAFIWLMLEAHFIISDSGGIQEESAVLGKPVLVMRDFSERPEAIGAGSMKLVGTDKDRIYNEAMALLDDDVAYQRMATKSSVYGDGQSADRIAGIIADLKH